MMSEMGLMLVQKSGSGSRYYEKHERLWKETKMLLDIDDTERSILAVALADLLADPTNGNEQGREKAKRLLDAILDNGKPMTLNAALLNSELT